MKDSEELFNRLVENLKPVNCKTIKRNEKDKIVKGKKDKPDTKEREISITKKCELKPSKDNSQGKDAEPLPDKERASGRGSAKVSVDKDKFNYMVNNKDGKEQEPTDMMVDYDALLRMLKEDDSMLEDLVVKIIEKIKLQQETKRKKMSHW